MFTVDELATEVKSMYGPVARSALRNAMRILVASRCAQQFGADRWQVAWGDLSHRGGEEVGEVLARRTQRPPAKGPIRRLNDAYADSGVPNPAEPPKPDPGRLF